jgi:cysteine-rich repeat protein
MNTADAGSLPDSGAGDAGTAGTLDAGLAFDSGLPSDAGMEPDGGAVNDAGAIEDAGESADAGAADSGIAEDAGTDAGIAPDAGGHDAGAADSGLAEDAGTDAGPADSGTAQDAGTDAGIAPDAGGPDAGAAPDAGVAQVCGDGVVEGTEQCDDGNLFNLDGCDSSCQYEMITRVSSLAISTSAAPSFCTPAKNLLGQTLLNSTLSQNSNTTMRSAIDAATTNVLMQYFGVTGTTTLSGPMIGMMSGTPDPSKGTWPGNNPVDWWFLADTSGLSSTGVPTTLLSLTDASGDLTAGPADISLTLPLFGSPATIVLRNAMIGESINGTNDAPAPPPLQLAAGFEVFENATGNASTQGLCGGMTVDSLAKIPVPSVFTTGGTACMEGYTSCGSNPVSSSCNSLLDVFVSGCTASGLPVHFVTGSQPDVPANTTVTTLSAGSGLKVPSSATDGDEDAYSSYFTFTGTRAHATNCYAQMCSIME